MSFILILLFYLLSFIIHCNYILIPFDIFIYNPKYNNSLQEDFLSMKFSEDIYINLTIGNPKQIIKAVLRLDQYELIITEQNYNYALSNSFKFNNYIQNKYTCNDTFHLITINTSNELNDYIHKDKVYKQNLEQSLYKVHKDIKFVFLNNTSTYKYLEKEFEEKEIEKIIKINYGMAGLRLRYMNIDSSPDLIKSLRNIKAINSSIFTFLFNDNKKDEHYGYLVIGDKVIDTEKEYEETNNTYFGLRSSRLSWDLKTETIYSESKKDLKNKNFYLEKNMDIELKIEKSYILGTYNYKKYIENIFFKDLIDKNICQYKKLLVEFSYGTYICDSKSKIFKDYYDNIFPDLVIKTEKIIDDLILTKKDLFLENKYNDSDTNIYFMIYFSTIYTTKWMFGRPFFEKYRLSFNIDKSFIIYHKKKFNEEKEENNDNVDMNKKDNKILKIIIIIFLILMIFFLGFLFHKSITKMPRKHKANELDDEFDYESHNEKKNEENKLIND